MMSPEALEVVDDFAPFGIRAFTTTRQAGSYGSGSDEPIRDVMARWDAVRGDLRQAGVRRLATASQVHGRRILPHSDGWEGWLRSDEADGHYARHRGTALAVTIADCVPVFLAAPSGACAVLHSGWRGTAARIVDAGIDALLHDGAQPADVRMHLGPAICGACYEVSADVLRQVTGQDARGPATVDLRAVIADHARARGVRAITTSPWCTRCHNARFFSHRAGDAGRQIAVIAAAAG